MVAYKYSGRDQLQSPFTYMYAPFEGRKFLIAYIQERQKTISECNLKDISLPADEQELISRFQKEYFDHLEKLQSQKNSNEQCSVEKMQLEQIIEQDEIVTGLLLEKIVSTQFKDQDSIGVSDSLNKLQKRFEVTKKLFKFYQSGLTRGYGDSNSIYSYWQLSVALLSSYCLSGSLTHFSTFLKLSDLLCSQKRDDLFRAVAPRLLGLQLVIEVRTVQELMRRFEVVHDS